MFEYKSVIFMLNRKCKYECHSCVSHCNSDAGEKLPREVVLNVLKNIPAKIKEVSFTGGEPLEEFEDLKDYISLARKMNKIVKCETSCFWADDYENTLNLLKELKSAGLAKIIIDYDGIHYQKEKVNNVINVMDGAKEIHIGVDIKVTNMREKKLGDEINLLGNRVVNLGIKVLENTEALNQKVIDESVIGRELRRNLFINYDGNMYLYMYGRIIDKNPIANIYSQQDLSKIISQNNGFSYECEEGMII